MPGCLNDLCGFPFGMGYMVDMFRNRVKNYVEQVCVYNENVKINSFFYSKSRLIVYIYLHNFIKQIIYKTFMFAVSG